MVGVLISDPLTALRRLYERTKYVAMKATEMIVLEFTEFIIQFNKDVILIGVWQ